MKLVFTVEEVAAALQMSIAEFSDLRPVLEDLEFPKPLHGLGQRWSIMDVISWVNQNGGGELASDPMHRPGNSRLLHS